MEILSHTTKAEALLARFVSLLMAVHLKKDWRNVPALAKALSDTMIAIENFRQECGQAVNFTGAVYNSPYLPGDVRFEQFSAILNEVAGQFGLKVESIGNLASVQQLPTTTPFRTDAELITYARHLESEAIEGIRLMRLAAKIVDAQGRGQVKGIIIDIEV